MTKQALSSLWEKEKNAYQEKEIGSGVQLFVKKLLQCEEIFNLKEANLSTPEQDRRNEFLEESSKKQKRADVIIYIDNQIVIPMEIERYGNIQAGEKQLFDYQLVWDKKTGILTDGNEWRFYVGKIPIRTFFLQDIFGKTAEFLTFWKEYIQPINYYLNFFRTTGQGALFAEEDLNVEAYRQNFFKDITTLINSFQYKLNLKGYFSHLDEGTANKNAIELTYSYIIQFILYKTLADNGFADFKSDFQLRIERIERNLNTALFSDILTVPKFISVLVSKNVYKPFKSEQEVIDDTLNTILAKPTHLLQDVTPWLDIFVFIKRYSFANIRNEIFGFIYENYLKQLYNENLGQYFTAPEVVDFMLEELGYAGETLAKNSKKDKVSIIDPSCGSGTFLYSAVRNLIESLPNETKADSEQIERLITENIFGIDVAEFPLYLAEMSMIMRMLPLIINEDYTNVLDKKIKVFKTKDSIAEFLDTAVKNTVYDIQKQIAKSKGQGTLDFGDINLGYKSFVRDEDDLKNLKRSLENQETPPISRYRFDYVIGNPPYISYNESSSRGTLFFQFIKEGKVKLNDVYGVNLHSIPENPKGYRPNPNLYAFFIALGLGLLKDGGKLSFIVPQTMLTAGDLDVIRYHLAQFTTIEKIVIVDSQLFTDRGLKQNYTVATSNLIFFVKKQMPFTHRQNKVEIVYHIEKEIPIEECIEQIRNFKSKKIRHFEVTQAELLRNAKNWNFLKLDQEAQDFYHSYFQGSTGMEIYYSHSLAKEYFNDLFYFDGGYMVMEKEALDEPQAEMINYEIAKIDEKKIQVPENKRYIPNKRTGADGLAIKLRQASQGYSLLDSPYKIVWSTRNLKQFHFTKRPLIWANNRLGGIGSTNKSELLFLFALLNSSVNHLIIKQFLKLEGEKDLLLQINFVKEFIRVPTFLLLKQTSPLKAQIIQKVEQLLATEQVKLTDLVDFTNVLVQKFDSIEVENELLILKNQDSITKCKIKKDKDLVERFAKENTENLTLKQLKSALVIDENKQTALRKEIDDLVFCLYFNTQLTDLEQNKYYQYLQNAKK
ncbi:MAG: SAM-dependent methyltransferase [Thermoflexibacter sp.]|nr:SAM-dependent methyltransferase [Thermoflexibacter sp.]